MKARASKLLKSEQRPGQNVTDRELQGAISPADIQAAKIFESGAEAAKSIQASFYQMERDYVANQNEMVANEATLVMLTKRFQESLGEMWEKYNQALHPEKPAAAPSGVKEAIEGGQHPAHGEFLRSQDSGSGWANAQVDSAYISGKKVTVHTYISVADSNDTHPLTGTGRTRADYR